MKLKDIKGLLPEPRYSKFNDKLAERQLMRYMGYNLAISEIGEKEIEIDMEKIIKEINPFNSEIVHYSKEDIKKLVQTIVKEFLIKAKK